MTPRPTRIAGPSLPPMLLLAWLLAAFAPTAHAAPAHYQVGTYVVAVHGLNIADGTFDADLWVWATGTDPKRQPLQSMEFVNADKVASSLDSPTVRGKLLWRERKVAAAFCHHRAQPRGQTPGLARHGLPRGGRADALHQHALGQHDTGERQRPDLGR